MQFYTFGLGQTYDESILTPARLGGKGAGLMWMSAQGAPIPPGFVIPTSVWAEYDKKPKTTMKAIAKLLPEYLALLDAHFGYLPLLSVRSGSRLSCPGMMDTILNVGLDASTADAWTARLGSECYASSYARLVTMFGSVVKGLRRETLEAKGVAAYEVETGEPFPDAKTQLLESIEAVFKSWDNERAKVYRKMNDIPRQDGTAVTVQAMVFGNLNDQSGTGVLFTRNPDTGKCEVTGEFLTNAQGEDIVAGTRTPQPLSAMKWWDPTAHAELLEWVLKLEKLRKDVQDVEFTVQDGKLYLLQTRSAKRSAAAAIRIALDMAGEGLITKTEAVQRVGVKTYDQAQLATLDPKWKKQPAYTGTPACSGVVSGKPVFTKEDALKSKEPCILVTKETTPDDIAGMYAAVGVLTMVGGLTSHAAVNSRGMNRACIVGVGQSVEAFKDVEVLSMDGATGKIWTEAVPIIGAKSNGLIQEFGELVLEIVGALPIIFELPKQEMAQAVLYLGEKMLDPAAAVQLIAETSKKVTRLYVDLSVGNGPEAEFFSICETFDPAQQVANLLAQWTPAESHAVVLLGDVVTDKPMLTTGKSLRALVLADGELLMDGPDTLDRITLDLAKAKVLQWKQAEGLQLVSVGQVVPEVKSFVSVPQALQLVGV